MFAGMATLGLALGAPGEPAGYATPLVEHGLMGAAMAAPMVAWMRHRGHAWSDGLEMTAAMLGPGFLRIHPAERGIARSLFGLSGAAAPPPAPSAAGAKRGRRAAGGDRGCRG